MVNSPILVFSLCLSKAWRIKVKDLCKKRNTRMISEMSAENGADAFGAAFRCRLYALRGSDHIHVDLWLSTLARRSIFSRSGGKSCRALIYIFCADATIGDKNIFYMRMHVFSALRMQPASERDESKRVTRGYRLWVIWDGKRAIDSLTLMCAGTQ